MNKDIFDQLPADEQPVATKLNSISENMKVPLDFQWTLESQLMDTYKNKTRPATNWFSKIIVPASWAIAAVIGFILLNWTIRSLVPPEQINPATPNTVVPIETFETKVRQGTICTGQLAVAHGLSVALTNEDKTAFIPFNQEEPGSEFRSFIWSTDGKQLAILGNIRGSGNIYLAESPDYELLPLLANSDFGYLYDFAWSSNGRQMVLWSSQNTTTLYLLSTLGHGLIEKRLGVQILGTPQFAPNGRHIVFYGADATTAGLFLMTQEDLEPVLLVPYVQDSSSFAFSPDGSLLAYMEYDREVGEARLSTQNLTKGEYNVLGTLSIPKGLGSSVPQTANLSWSQDGTKLVFEFGRGVEDRAIYIANADGSGMIKIVESAHAPTVSSDGNCLAYISNKKVIVLDLNQVSLASNSATSFLLTDLPTVKGTADFRLDKLQWQP